MKKKRFFSHTKSFLVETDGTRYTQWWFDVHQSFSHISGETKKNYMQETHIFRLAVQNLRFYFTAVHVKPLNETVCG